MAFDLISFIVWPPSLILVTTILLYNLSQTFKFYFKLTLYYLIIATVCCLAIPPACVQPFHVENTNIVARLMTAACRIFGIKWVIHGEEYLKTPGPAVVICNHQSAVDVLGLMVLWPILKRCVSMVKKELQYALSFGLLATLCGTVFIDRLNSEKARNTIKNTVDYLKKKNTKVWIFPEGTRNMSDTMLPFKKGAFHLAVQGQLPILPIIFSSYSDFYNSKKKLFETGTVNITILPPVSTEGLSVADVNDLTDRLRNQMLEVFQKTLTTNSCNGVTNGPVTGVPSSE